MMVSGTGSGYTFNLVSELLDRCLEGLLRGLCRIVFHGYGLVIQAYVQSLHTFLERDVLLDLLHTVHAVQMHIEDDFLDLFGLLRLLLGLGCRSCI